MTDRNSYLLADDSGNPAGVVDVEAINARGARLAFALAAGNDQPKRIEALMGELIAEVSPREVGYVSAAALGTVVQDILEPLVQIAEEVGVPMRERLAGDATKLAQGF
ncbi:hypothetical protein [Modestobacter sp. SYSU DS0290]